MQDKKQAAAISAVLAYIQTEEEMAAMCGAMGDTAGAGVPNKQASVRLWGVSGRHAQMQMRQFLQLKNFHGSRLR